MYVESTYMPATCTMVMSA